jgi:hypothetical protein
MEAAGVKPFSLSVRGAGQCLETDPKTAWRWLRILETDGILKMVARGSNVDRKASRFRYVEEL